MRDYLCNIRSSKLGFGMLKEIEHRSERYWIISTAFITLLLFITSMTILFQTGNIMVTAQDDADPIDIHSNSDLSGHPELDSGSGTSANPYIFANLDIDCRSLGVKGISLQNTTRYVIFRNITIHADNSAPGIYIRSLYSGGNYHSIFVTLDNVTVIGGGTHLEMYVPIRVNVNNCNFSNPSGSGNIIHSYYGYYIAFDNNTINAPDMDIFFEYTSYTYVRRNNYTIRDLEQSRFRYSDISNNTFNLRTMKLFSGYFSYIQGNHISGKSTGYDICWLYDCNRIWIANNSFIGGKDGIVVQHPNSYSPVRNNYEWWSSLTFEYNHFNNTAERGIYFYWRTGHPYISHMQVHHNEFIGCVGYAIELASGGSSTSKVFRNVFEYNHGSSHSYSTILAQCRDGWSQFRWYDNSVGNFWRDWDNTDQNNDGFADTGNYPLYSNNGQVDPFPVSNPFFDFEEPTFQVLKPTNWQLTNRYVNFTWSASDTQTGISMIQIKKGISPWINVTNRDHHGLYLSQGQHLIELRAVDGAGLKNSTSLNIRIQNPTDPVEIISPLNDHYYDVNEIQIQWDLINDFVPLSLDTSLDEGEWTTKDPFGDHIIVLGEGMHEYSMRFADHYGNEIDKSVSFTIDTIDPDLDILYPKPGSVISNGLVRFRWEHQDASEISRTTLIIDGEDPFDIEGTTHSSFLENGGHSIEVEVEDMAGNIATNSMFFTISKNTSLHITSPLLDRPTSIKDHDVKWEYLTELDIFKIQLILDDQDPMDLPIDVTSHLVRLSGDGLHEITIKAQDPAGNIFSDSIAIHLDNTRPSVGFLSPKNGDRVNRTEITIRWSASELGGIFGYDLLIDDEVIAKGTSEMEMSVSLSEGEHTISIIAIDLAGNVDEEEITITIDTTPPMLELLYPADDVVTDPYISLRWIGTDALGILRYNFSLDGKNTIELGNIDNREIQITEGDHILILRAIDLAGNVRILVKEFTADINGPLVDLDKTISNHIDHWSGLISWNITEMVGLRSIDLTLDGVNFSLSTDSRYYIADLEDGPHSISILVTDIGGWTDSDHMTFILDTKAPGFERSTDPVEVISTTAKIFWEITETESGITMTVRVNGKVVTTNTDPLDGEMIMTELSSGSYSVNITFTDLAGNEKILHYDLLIEPQKDGGGSDGRSFLPLILGILLVIAMIALVIFLVFRNKGEKKEEKRITESAKRPDKISIGPLPSRPAAPFTQLNRKGIHQPKTAVKHTQTVGPSTADGGYIRPERKKRAPSRLIKDIPTTSGPDKEMPSQKRSKPEDDIEEWGNVDDWSDMEEMEEFEEMEEV